MDLDDFIIGKTKERRGEERRGEGRFGKKKAGAASQKKQYDNVRTSYA